MKKCTVCKTWKSMDEYFNSKRSKDGKGYRCKSCDKKVRAKSRSRSKATQDGYRRRQVAFAHGITVDDYDRMFDNQDGKCAICGTTNPHGEGSNSTYLKNLSIDHCHKTGRIRGLLCNKCNRGIGLLQDDSELLQRAIEYLK